MNPRDAIRGRLAGKAGIMPALLTLLGVVLAACGQGGRAGY